jgi:hypothetical protein
VAVSRITYDFLPPGERNPDTYPMLVRTVEASETSPPHSFGEIVRLRDRRREDPRERDYKVVGMTPRVTLGFADTGLSMQIIHVVVADGD